MFPVAIPQLCSCSLNIAWKPCGLTRVAGSNRTLLPQMAVRIWPTRCSSPIPGMDAGSFCPLFYTRFLSWPGSAVDHCRSRASGTHITRFLPPVSRITAGMKSPAPRQRVHHRARTVFWEELNALWTSVKSHKTSWEGIKGGQPIFISLEIEAGPSPRDSSQVSFRWSIVASSKAWHYCGYSLQA